MYSQKLFEYENEQSDSFVFHMGCYTPRRLSSDGRGVGSKIITRSGWAGKKFSSCPLKHDVAHKCQQPSRKENFKNCDS